MIDPLDLLVIRAFQPLHGRRRRIGHELVQPTPAFLDRISDRWQFILKRRRICQLFVVDAEIVSQSVHDDYDGLFEVFRLVFRDAVARGRRIFTRGIFTRGRQIFARVFRAFRVEGQNFSREEETRGEKVDAEREDENHPRDEEEEFELSPQNVSRHLFYFIRSKFLFYSFAILSSFILFEVSF